MKGKFIFWAQALDNSSPDHFDMYGEELAPENTASRQTAVSNVSDVIKTGTRVFESKGVQLTANRQHFVVEVPSAQRDRVGRIAPIVCYGDYGGTVDDALGEAVANGLAHFAKQIGRSVLPEHFKLVGETFAALKKKSSKRKFVLVVAIVTAILFLLLLGFCLLASRVL